MPSAEARIPTDRAARYLEQLCSHLGAMGHMRHLPAGGHGGAGMPRVENIKENGNRAVIRFNDGSWALEAQEDALVLRVDAEEAAALERLKEAIAARITKIGRRDGLAVTWSSPADPDERHGLAAGARVRFPRQGGGQRWWRRIGWFALAGLALAIHLGLIGSLLGGGRWKDAAADAIIALIAVKLILLALHARLGRGRSHRAASHPDPAGPEARG
jgi:hypothetical protein